MIKRVDNNKRLIYNINIPRGKDVKTNEREKEKQSQEANPRKVTSCNRNPESRGSLDRNYQETP